MNKKEVGFNEICEWALSCGFDVEFISNIEKLYSPEREYNIQKFPEIRFRHGNRWHSVRMGTWKQVIDVVVAGREGIFAELAIPPMPGTDDKQ